MTWAGKLLVATPELVEPTFARTVLLLLQHSAGDGALGVVVNRPSGTPVGEVLPSWSDVVADPGAVFVGGPVQPEAAICLGLSRTGVPPSAHLAPLPGAPLLSTVDLDADPLLVQPLVRGLRVFAGCAGWSPGQLEGEVGEGSWWVLDSLPGDPFVPAPELLWRQVLRRQRGRLALYSTWPDDVAAN